MPRIARRATGNQRNAIKLPCCWCSPSLCCSQALAKFAFGLGSIQVLLCTALFSACALPVGRGLATIFLEQVANAPPNLVSIRSVDEAVVIGAALSMSSSAFVLQLLSERGETTSKVGSATLGVLLFQDIAVVPLLVLLPLITGPDAANFSVRSWRCWRACKLPPRLALHAPSSKSCH